LRALPWVKTVTVKRSFPHSVVIDVDERKPIGVWQIGAVSYVVGDDGIVVDAASPDSGLPVVDASRAGATVRVGDRVDADALVTAQRIADALPNRIGQTAVHFLYDRQSGLTVVTDRGAQVRVGDGKDLDYKLALWQAVAAKVSSADLHELDLRFGDRPYYR
jgi:cell division protein FtsQ